MYDDGPPDPEPIICPFCEEELGTSDDCAHCKLANECADIDHKHSRLQHLLACRVRQLAAMPLYADAGGAVSPRHMQAVAMLLDLGGLKLPAEFMEQARAHVTNEYGESNYTGKTDEQLAAMFLDATVDTYASSRSATYSADVLDRLPQTSADVLTWGDHGGGQPFEVMSHADARLHGRGHSCQWGVSLRESIRKAITSRDENAAFWLEFYRDYLQRPKNLVPPHDPSRVRGGDQPKVSFVIGDTAYTSYVGKHKSPHFSNQGLGFGGAEFVIRLDDGREFFSDNTWHRGTVPPKLRKLMPSNAVFVKREQHTDEAVAA